MACHLSRSGDPDNSRQQFGLHLAFLYNILVLIVYLSGSLDGRGRGYQLLAQRPKNTFSREPIVIYLICEHKLTDWLTQRQTLIAICLTAIFTQKPTSLGFQRQGDKVERMIECLLTLFECLLKTEKRGAFCAVWPSHFVSRTCLGSSQLPIARGAT